MAGRTRALEGEPLSSFWQDRAVFVTGGTGFLGGSIVRQLLRQGAQVACLIRDWTPESELIGSDLLQQVTTIRGSFMILG